MQSDYRSQVIGETDLFPPYKRWVESEGWSLRLSSVR
jgi:hypothetical protein